MKFCKDCIYHQPSEYRSYYDTCNAPQAWDAIDPVTGEKSRTFSYCDILRQGADRVSWFRMRAPKGRCGEKAHWFVAKREGNQ